MILDKGGGIIENTTLFGKYQLCRELGRGRSGTVYLARHKDLEEDRVIKRIPKAGTNYQQFRQEALILKTLRHPGIPIVYDLEEDEEFSYLIEEFLEGDSLYSLISDRGHFSTAMTIRYGVQICHLVNTLHFARPNPILYLDLQPKNLLLCDDVIKLVDFDHAVHQNEADRLTKRYGTEGCAAPEQYTMEALDERTDIYAIGAVLHYMLTGTYPGKALPVALKPTDRRLVKIIRTCLQEDKGQRYQTVEQLRHQLEQITKEQTGVFKKNQNSSLTIAIAGAKAGNGTTHLAMGLAAYLTKRGFAALYEECDDSGGIRQFASCFSAGMDAYGIFRILGQPMLPGYGGAVKLPPHNYPIIVQDYGSNWPALASMPADAAILVCTGKPWNRQQEQAAGRGLGSHPALTVIYNHFCGPLTKKQSGPAKNTKVFLMPYYPNPFHLTKPAADCFEQLWSELAGSQTGGTLQKCLRHSGRYLGKRRRKAGGGPSVSSGPADIQA